MDCSGFLNTTSLFPEPSSIDSFSPSFFLPIHGTHHVEQSIAFPEVTDKAFRSDGDSLGRDLSTEFAEHLTALSISLPREHPEHDPSINLALGLTILTTSNIQTFIRLYFHHWNHHSPIVHRGTFDITTASLPLLLVITLTGALFAWSPDDVILARNMLNIAEEFVFRDPSFCQLCSGVSPNGTFERRLALEALQAAFSITQLQFREGSVQKREYVRTFRFDQIIYVSFPTCSKPTCRAERFQAARAMSLHNLTIRCNEDQAEAPRFFDWKDFGETEAKIR